MACDYCGKLTGNLDPLVKMCETKNVKSVCPECARIITDKKSFFMFKMAEKRLTRWIEKTRKTQ